MKSMKKLLALSLVLAATLVLSACGNTAGSPDNGNEIEGTMKPVVWKIESAYGTGDQCMDIQLPMLKKVIEETTGGLVTVEMYEPDTICAPADIPMAVVNGTLQGAISSSNDTCAIVEAAYCETTPRFSLPARISSMIVSTMPAGLIFSAKLIMKRALSTVVSPLKAIRHSCPRSLCSALMTSAVMLSAHWPPSLTL